VHSPLAEGQDRLQRSPREAVSVRADEREDAQAEPLHVVDHAQAAELHAGRAQQGDDRRKRDAVDVAQLGRRHPRGPPAGEGKTPAPRPQPRGASGQTGRSPRTRGRWPPRRARAPPGKATRKAAKWRRRPHAASVPNVGVPEGGEEEARVPVGQDAQRGGGDGGGGGRRRAIGGGGGGAFAPLPARRPAVGFGAGAWRPDRRPSSVSLSSSEARLCHEEGGASAAASARRSASVGSGIAPIMGTRARAPAPSSVPGRFASNPYFRRISIVVDARIETGLRRMLIRERAIEASMRLR